MFPSTKYSRSYFYITNLKALIFRSDFKYILLVTCLSLSFSCFTSAQDENYISYQTKITTAENLMFDSLYTESIAAYRDIFNEFSYNFPKDCLIAAQVASYTGDYENAFYFLKKAVIAGAKIERINQIRLLSKLDKDTIRHAQFIKEYPVLLNAYYATLNKEYKHLCDSFYNEDQRLRDKDQKVLNNMFLVWRMKIRKDWEENCKRGIHVLIDSLSPQFGFPSGRIIGVIDSLTIPGVNVSLSSAQVLIMLYHFPFYTEQYKENLKTALIKGEISARDYAVTMEFHNRGRKKFRDGENSLYYIRWEVPPRPDETYPTEEEINARRQSIGLSNCRYERIRKLWQHMYYSGMPDSFELFYYEF